MSARKIRIAAIGLFAGLVVTAAAFTPLTRAAGPAPAAPAAAMAPAAPTKVAVIDLRKAYISLKETKATEDTLKGLAGELETKKKSHKDQLDEMQKDISNTAKPGTEQHDKLMNDFDKKTMEFQGAEQDLQIRMVRLRGRQMARAFGAIQAKVAEIAKAKGYDIVLVNQSSELPDTLADLPNLETMQNAIFSRNMIYVAPGSDITEEVIASLDAAATPAK
jgi:Skp family chaperone for outer membrane proteins